MGSADIIDDINTLLKLGVGDSFRLEHIKQAHIENKTIWITDENYLKQLQEKYIIKSSAALKPDGEIVFEDSPADEEMVHCWKCGKKMPMSASFCMICGSSLFNIGDGVKREGDKSKSSFKNKTQSSSKSKPRSIPLKVIAIIGVMVIISIIVTIGQEDSIVQVDPDGVQDTDGVVVDNPDGVVVDNPDGVVVDNPDGVVVDNPDGVVVDNPDGVQDADDMQEDLFSSIVAIFSIPAIDWSFLSMEQGTECEEGMSMDNKTDSCIPDITCEAGMVVDNMTNTCVPVVTCDPGMVVDKDTNTCIPVVTCGPGMQVDNITNTCIPV